MVPGQSGGAGEGEGGEAACGYADDSPGGKARGLHGSAFIGGCDDAVERLAAPGANGRNHPYGNAMMWVGSSKWWKASAGRTLVYPSTETGIAQLNLGGTGVTSD